MTNTDLFHEFERFASQPNDADAVFKLVKTLCAAGRKATRQDRIALAGTLAHTAFLAPDRTAQIYDVVSTAWLGQPVKADPIATLNLPPEPLPPGLWKMFWAVVEDAVGGKLDAAGITARTAALGGAMPDAFTERVAHMSFTYPGIKDLDLGDLPPKIDLDTLANQPEGSLGAAFHALIVDNKFDLEVLDRAEIGLADLPSPLDYLNTRILQAHDLWHITAGYETTALHEIALSGFQMAQFGHNYSAQFLSVVAAVAALSPAAGYKILLDTITTSWVHGRETPQMMLIPWEDVWHQTPANIRVEFGITEYVRPHRADLIEKTAPIAALIKRISSVLRLFRRPVARST
jgi:ubiquinone biosynthesis protein Coq4